MAVYLAPDHLNFTHCIKRFLFIWAFGFAWLMQDGKSGTFNIIEVLVTSEIVCVIYDTLT